MTISLLVIRCTDCQGMRRPSVCDVNRSKKPPGPHIKAVIRASSE
jgi:hypothetical protein